MGLFGTFTGKIQKSQAGLEDGLEKLGCFAVLDSFWKSSSRNTSLVFALPPTLDLTEEITSGPQDFSGHTICRLGTQS